MKIKTSELIGQALDWVVAKLEGVPVDHPDYVWKIGGTVYRYATDWAQGGPIIDREGISLTKGHSGWWIAKRLDVNDEEHYVTVASTPLIAAMRCYVASKLGDEVDIPEELVK